MGEMSVMGSSGDVKVSWDSDNEEEVKAAKKTFNECVKEKKFAAFSVDKRGKKDERIYDFDSSAEEIILVPPIAGG